MALRWSEKNGPDGLIVRSVKCDACLYEMHAAGFRPSDVPRLDQAMVDVDHIVEQDGSCHPTEDWERALERDLLAAEVADELGTTMQDATRMIVAAERGSL